MSQKHLNIFFFFAIIVSFIYIIIQNKQNQYLLEQKNIQIIRDQINYNYHVDSTIRSLEFLKEEIDRYARYFQSLKYDVKYTPDVLYPPRT